MFQDSHSNGEDPWAEWRKRRQEWRARRREQRREWRQRWHSGDWAQWADWTATGAGMGAPGMGGPGMGGNDPSKLQEMKARMDSMEKTILTLAERIKVLERLATDDERQLAAEIEKLRQEDGNKPKPVADGKN